MYKQIVKESAKKALEMVAAERERARRKFDYDHDDQHANGELVTAAVLISIEARDRDESLVAESESWMHELAEKVKNKYGKNYKQRLVIATAMLLAEIERLDREETVEAQE